MVPTPALVTLAVCFIMQKARLSLVIPYALIASQITDWTAWGAMTLLLFFFFTYEEIRKSVE